jgi:hypothetical protein
VFGQEINQERFMSNALPLTSTHAHSSGNPPEKPQKNRVIADDFFGLQLTSTAELPNPEPLLINLTRCIIEVLAGARELDQVSRWVTDDVYRHLLKRVVLAARARRVKSQSMKRPNISVGLPRITQPRDGVVEAVVMVHQRARSRAVAIRLEGLDGRWRASSVNVL